MKPENTKERKSLFIKLLIFYIIGVVIVIIPVYMTIRQPGIQNQQTSEELNMINEQIAFQRDYVAVQMDSVKGLLDNFETKVTDKDKLNADIGLLLSEMEKAVSKDTTWRLPMNNNIISTYLELKKLHNKVIELSDELSETQKDLAKSQKAARSASKPKKTDSLD